MNEYDDLLRRPSSVAGEVGRPSTSSSTTSSSGNLPGTRNHNHDSHHHHHHHHHQHHQKTHSISSVLYPPSSLASPSSPSPSSSSTNHQAKRKGGHTRTRSVDLRLPSTPSSPTTGVASSSGISSSTTSIVLSAVEEKVARWYYQHGLNCSRHPFLVILVALSILVVCAYPIFTFRGAFGHSSELYLTTAQEHQRHHHRVHQTPRNNNQNHHHHHHHHQNGANGDSDSSRMRTNTNPLSQFDVWSADDTVPRWFQPNQSFAYIQQIYVRSAVVPWTSEMQLVDALRGPFGAIFELVETVSNFQYQNPESDKVSEPVSLSEVCFQVGEPTLSRRYQTLSSHLPSYSCLMLSPANVWRGDRTRFQQDSNFLSTLLKFQDSGATPLPSSATHDLFYGVSFDETGIRRTYGRNRVRTITYAITMVLRQNAPGFLDALRTYLQSRYTLKDSKSEGSGEARQAPQPQPEVSGETAHIYFSNTFTFNYLVPVVTIYLCISLYMYFSVRKVEVVRNKLLYAFGALATVLFTLTTIYGICFRLHLHSVLVVNRILPFFIAFISFENIFVLTRSVLANPHLDSRVRIAQGLSRDGVSITKNLLAELTLLAIGSIAFPPVFQECCILASLCLLMEFVFLITFFTPAMSLFTQRINERSIKKTKVSMLYPRNIYAEPGQEPVLAHTPKRLRIFYFFARIRLVQRCLILILCAGIGVAIYNAYLVLEQTGSVEEPYILIVPKDSGFLNSDPELAKPEDLKSSEFEAKSLDQVPAEKKNKQRSLIKILKSALKRSEPEVPSSGPGDESRDPYWRIRFTERNPIPTPLSNHHWANLFALYNMSLVGRYVTLLPPILLSVPMRPEKTVSIRNTADSDYDTLKRFIPIKFTNGEYVIDDDDDFDKFELHEQDFQWTRHDVYLALLCLPSMLFLIYLFIQLYRCVCTRNYAEWRAQMDSDSLNPFRWEHLRKLVSLASGSTASTGSKSYRFDITMLNFDREREHYYSEKQFLANNQDIDHVATSLSTSLVATSSMSGDIRVYDALTCEALTFIKRSRARGPCSVYKPNPVVMNNDDDLNQQESPSETVARTDGNILRNFFHGISLEDEDELDDGNEVDKGEEEESDSSRRLQDFKPIWCIDIYDRYVLAGCGGDEGRLEVWNAYDGQLAYVYLPESATNGFEHQHGSNWNAISTLKVTYWGVALARMSGLIELLEVEDEGKEYTGRFGQKCSSKPSIRYRIKYRLYAHKQPITKLEIIDSLEDEEFIRIFGSRGCLISGSLDTTLKVFAADNGKLIYTFNGHCGAIVTIYIDPYSTASALSGCQLGQLCVWDLNTGTCIFSMQAHSQGEVLSISASPLYYVSIGTDNRICIWDRYSGNLIHAIPQQYSECHHTIFVDSYLLVSVRDSELVVWDVNDARPTCILSLVSQDSPEKEKTFQTWTKSYQSASIRHLKFSYQRQAIICDYGNSLCVINNPFALEGKLD